MLELRLAVKAQIGPHTRAILTKPMYGHDGSHKKLMDKGFHDYSWIQDFKADFP